MPRISYARLPETLGDWDLAGAVENSRLFFQLGVAVANADPMPSWRPGDELEATRQRSLAKAQAAP